MIIMCIGVSTFSQKQYPLFLAKPPLLNLQTAQPPPRPPPPPIYWFFVNPLLPLKIGFFSEPPKY